VFWTLGALVLIRSEALKAGGVALKAFFIDLCKLRL
jgi:hypothetical protein